MRALVVLASLLGGCLAGNREHLLETSPRFWALGPRSVAVVVAGEDPRDARAEVDKFLVRYPAPISGDTKLPASPELASNIAKRLSEGLVRRLQGKGYQAEAIDGSGKRVGDILRSSDMDAVLVVSFRSVHSWPVSEFKGTEIRQVGTLQEEISHFNFTIERGLLLLPTAYLLDRRTARRLWSHSNLGLQSDRVSMADPVRRLGFIARDEPPPAESIVPRAVDAVLNFYFDSIPRAPESSPPPPSPERHAELLDEAAIDRWRIHDRLVFDVGVGYARRTLTLKGPFSVEIAGDPAFGGYWNVELGARVLGRRWAHGPRLALQRSSADYDRLVLRSDDAEPFREVSLRGATALDLAYTLSRAWQPRRWALLAAGLGPQVALGIFSGDQDGLDDSLLVHMGVVVEGEAMWAGETFLVGPFVRGAWMAGLQGGNGGSWVAGARVAASY